MRDGIFLRKKEEWLQLWLQVPPAESWELTEEECKPTEKSRGQHLPPLPQDPAPAEGTKKHGEGGGTRESREMTHPRAMQAVALLL